MKKKKQANTAKSKQDVKSALADFRNRFNTQAGGTSASAYVGNTISENKTAKRTVRRVQNPK